MNKKLSKKIVLFIIAISIAILVLVGWTVVSQNLLEPEPANITTLNEGTQMHYDEINIGLSEVSGDNAMLVINKEDQEESTRKSVRTGDKFGIYGYKIEIETIKSVANISILPGTSHGYIKLVIEKE